MRDYRAIMELASDRNQLFQAIYDYFHLDTENSHISIWDLSNIRFEVNEATNFPAAFHKMLNSELLTTAKSLSADGWIEIDDEDTISLTPKSFYQKFAEEISAETKPIPGSDRYVSLNHNSESLIDLNCRLNELATEISSRNDLPVDADEAAALVQEISALISALRGKVVRLSVLQVAASREGVLGYLNGKFKDHALGGIIGSVISIMLKAFGIG